MQGRQFSTRTQQAVDRARAQKPTRKRLTRDGSGLTISPQEAFLDYNNIDTLLQASRPHSESLNSSLQNLFVPPPPGVEGTFPSEGGLVLTPKAASYEGTPSAFAPSSMLSAHEGTPSLVDASSNSSNGSRATSIISSPLQRLPFNREDTIRPSKSQTTLASQQSGNSADLFSPAYSTSSSTDDEDEKPYEPNGGYQAATPKWQFPFPAQNNHQHSLGQASHSGPRFSVVSSSSSESEEEERGRGSKNGSIYPPNRRSMGGYGYMANSQESGLSAPTTTHFSWQEMQEPMPSSTTSSSSASGGGQVDNLGPHRILHSAASGQSESQDEGPSLSPSIRSSAQAIGNVADTRQNVTNSMPFHQTTTNNASARQRSRSRNRVQANASANRRASEASSSSFEENSEWETGEEESEADGSDYRETRGATSTNTKNTTTTKKRRRGGVAARQAGVSSTTGGTTASTSHLTVCDYISPLTGESCKTEFHRPYDLARHRETIHAREEALLLRQGRIKKEQCVVLYKEVDPEKSLATVEWRCEGKNGCGSLFSRKDALLRHKRIRGH